MRKRKLSGVTQRNPEVAKEDFILKFFSDTFSMDSNCSAILSFYLGHVPFPRVKGNIFSSRKWKTLVWCSRKRWVFLYGEETKLDFLPSDLCFPCYQGKLNMTIFWPINPPVDWQRNSPIFLAGENKKLSWERNHRSLTTKLYPSRSFDFFELIFCNTNSKTKASNNSCTLMPRWGLARLPRVIN